MGTGFRKRSCANKETFRAPTSPFAARDAMRCKRGLRQLPWRRPRTFGRSLYSSPLPRKPLDHLDGARRAVPSQKFKLLVFQRVGRLEKFLELLDGSRGKAPHVLQIAFER